MFFSTVENFQHSITFKMHDIQTVIMYNFLQLNSQLYVACLLMGRKLNGLSTAVSTVVVHLI